MKMEINCIYVIYAMCKRLNIKYYTLEISLYHNYNLRKFNFEMQTLQKKK